MNDSCRGVQRPPAEIVYADELERLREWDPGPVPPGWRLSPRAVVKFVLGDSDLSVRRKFVGEPELVARVMMTLATNRGSMLVGEPGTAKSWLSELLAAAISGESTITVQGGSATRHGHILYSWNDGVLAAEGPTPRALVPGPLYRGMKAGKLVRFEEMARCPSEVQDAVLSILSDRVLHIPQLEGEAGIVFAREGFNVIGTANTRDRGVYEMSSALKRRMNFETILPIQGLDDEVAVVTEESERLLAQSGVTVVPEPETIEMLVTIFRELRSGQTIDGRSTDRLSTMMSTAEAVSVAHALGVYAHYLHEGRTGPEDLIHFLIGATLKDEADDRRRLRHYFDTEVVRKKGAHWKAVYTMRDLI
jgi:MoxR-like ATPase